jgi:uncharacterized protein (TIGR02246 family)
MTSHSPDVAVRTLYDRLLNAWNRRNAHDYAELFAPDGTVIGFDGSIMTGADIERTIGVIFADHPTATYVAKIRSVRPLGSHAILLHAIVGMIPPNGTDVNPDVNAHQILVAEDHTDAWRIVSFQNTPAQYHGRPDLVERHTREMQELLRQQTSTT